METHFLTSPTVQALPLGPHRSIPAEVGTTVPRENFVSPDPIELPQQIKTSIAPTVQLTGSGYKTTFVR